jgi:hypothetical protein
VAPPAGHSTTLLVFEEGARRPPILITNAFHILGRNSETSDTAVEGDTVSRQHAAFFHNADGDAFVRGVPEGSWGAHCARCLHMQACVLVRLCWCLCVGSLRVTGWMGGWVGGCVCSSWTLGRRRAPS